MTFSTFNTNHKCRKTDIPFTENFGSVFKPLEPDISLKTAGSPIPTFSVAVEIHWMIYNDVFFKSLKRKTECGETWQRKLTYKRKEIHNACGS